MASRSSLRASDTDREAVAERLRDAAVEGRLEADELEQRMHAALRARTYGELGRLLVDLPSKPLAWERRRGETLPAAQTAFAIAVRVAMTLAVVTVVLIAAAIMAAWWVVRALLWCAVRARRSWDTRSARASAPHRAVSRPRA